MIEIKNEDLNGELSKYWKGNQRMIDHCTRSSKYVEIDGWYVSVCDSKPSIESRMWYDDEQEDPGVGKERFMSYNKSMHMPELLDTRNSRYDYYLCRQYCGSNESLASVQAFERGDKLPDWVIRKLEPDEIQIVNGAIKEVQADYTNRLERYYNKYSGKIRSSGYWANR